MPVAHKSTCRKTDCRILQSTIYLLYKILILSGNYSLSLPVSTPSVGSRLAALCSCDKTADSMWQPTVVTQNSNSISTGALRPCHGSGEGPGSIPGRSMSDLWWKKWHWDKFIPEYFGFPLSISFHRCSIKIGK